MNEYTKSLKKEFIVKYTTKYFLYGYIFFFLGFISFMLGFVSFRFPIPYNVIAVISFFCLFLYGLYRFIRICISTKQKWKYYKVNKYRLATREFSNEWFRNEMHVPCMRLIIKDLCYEFGYKNEYKYLYQNFKSKNAWLDFEKEKALEEVLKRKKEE